jgi:hypothetical protein
MLLEKILERSRGWEFKTPEEVIEWLLKQMVQHPRDHKLVNYVYVQLITRIRP